MTFTAVDLTLAVTYGSGHSKGPLLADITQRLLFSSAVSPAPSFKIQLIIAFGGIS